MKKQKIYLMKELEVLLGISQPSIRKMMSNKNIYYKVMFEKRNHKHFINHSEYLILLSYKDEYVEQGIRNKANGYKRRLSELKNFSIKKIDHDKITHNYKKTSFFNFASKSLGYNKKSQPESFCLYSNELDRLKRYDIRT